MVHLLREKTLNRSNDWLYCVGTLKVMGTFSVSAQAGHVAMMVKVWRGGDLNEKGPKVLYIWPLVSSPPPLMEQCGKD